MKKILQYTISFGVAAALLYWVFKDVNLNEVWAKIRGADYRWVAGSAILALLAHWSRAYRWALMLEPLGYKPTIFRTTLAVLIGYITNLVLPRGGEFARSASLQRLENVPFEKSFGAVVAERVIDVLVLLILICLNLFLEFDRLSTFFYDFFGEKLRNSSTLLVFGLIGVLGIGFGFFLFKKYKEKISQNVVYQKVSKIIFGLWSGFSSVMKLKNPSIFIFHTVLIWSLYYAMTYFLCMAIPETANLSPLAMLTILVMGTIGMAAPTVGGLGSYHYLVGNIVVLYGINQQNGIILATFLHTLQGVIFVILFGVVSFIISAIMKPRNSEIK